MKNNIIMNSYDNHSAQSGFSLLELMIGLTIGLLIILGVTNVLFFTSSTQRTLSESTVLQQQANIIMRMIGYSLRQAGGSDLEVSLNETFVFSTTYNGYNASGFNVQGVEGGGGAGDTLRVSQIDMLDAGGNSSARDCLGNATAGALRGIRIDNQFSLNTNNQALMCLGSGTIVPQAVAVGVEDFQVRYGVATPGAGGTQNMQYFDADLVPDWAGVRAVQVCLRLSSVNANNEAAGGSVVTGCDGVNVAADGRLRKVFRNTFFLRNSLKAA